MSVTSVMVECIFCKSVINVLSDLAKDYKKHLVIEHKIMFDIDHVINRTLLVQHPSMARRKTCDCQLGKADDNFEDLLDSCTDYDDIMIETLTNDIARINENSSKNSLSNIVNGNSNIEEAEEDVEMESQTKDNNLINNDGFVNDDVDMTNGNEDMVNTDEEGISKYKNMVRVNEDIISDASDNIDNDESEKINERSEEVIIRDQDLINKINKRETNVVNVDKGVNNVNITNGGDDDMNGCEDITSVENTCNEDEDEITKAEDTFTELLIDKDGLNKEMVCENQLFNNHMEIANETSEDIKKLLSKLEFDSSYFSDTVESKIMENNQTDVCVVRRSTRISKLKDEGVSVDYRIDDNKKFIKTRSKTGEMCILKKETDTLETPTQLPWYYGCLYTCEECVKQFVDRREFIEHIETVHSITFEKYVATYTSKKILNSQHECEICGMGVAWYKTNLEKHIEMHDMKMDVYYDKYKSEFETPLLNISDPSLLQKLVTPNPSTDVSTNAGYDSSWTNRCIYLCKLCKKKIDSRPKFENHVKSVHKISMSKYSNKYGRTMEHEEKHHCQIKECTSKVFWEKMSISQHLKKCHNSMTIQHYEEFYMENYIKKDDTEVEHSWTDKCDFLCVICKSIFESKYKFDRHVQIDHVLSLGEYRSKHGNSMQKKELHHCQVDGCSSIVYWEKVAIYNHLHLKHDSLSLEDYKNQYMESYNEHKNLSKSKHSETKNIRKSQHSETSTWVNRCVYECDLCKDNLPSKRKFINHIMTKHRISFKEYKNKHNVHMLTEQKHHCQIQTCDAIILWDKSSIYRHLRINHNSMSLQVYNKQYMSNYIEKSSKKQRDKNSKPQLTMSNSWANQCIYKCKICHVTKKSKHSFKVHVNSQHDRSMKEYSKEHGTSIEHSSKHQCQIENCQSIILWDKTAFYQHLNKKHHKSISLEEYNTQYMSTYHERSSKVKLVKPTEDSWANRCVYKCNVCEITKKSRSSFKRHVISDHNMSLKEYSKEHGRTLEHKEMHTCQIENCQSLILWDTSAIYHHLFKKHNNSISLEKYCSQFMSSYSAKKNSVEIEVTSTSDSDSVSLWIKNEYKCRLKNCQFSCTGRNKLKGHLSKNHKILNVADYFKTHKNSRTTNEFHICQMCGTSVLWDLGPMQSHIYQSHRLTLESYRSTYMDNYSKHPKINKTYFEEAEESEEVVKWSAGSLLLCKICDEKVVGMYQFTKHLGNQHNFTYNKYEKSYKDFTLHTGWHFCKICDKNIKHDLQFLKAHMAEHDMSLEKYFKEFDPKMPKVVRIIEKYGYKVLENEENS